MWRSTSARGTPSVVITTWRSTNSQLVRLAEASVTAPPDDVCDVTALFQWTVASMTTDVPSRLRAAWAVGSVAGGGGVPQLDGHRRAGDGRPGRSRPGTGGGGGRDGGDLHRPRVAARGTG